MAIYTKSNGIKINTEDMPTKYIERALDKAKRENNAENIAILEEELQQRNEMR